ncbi:MAG: hypothetical protein ACTSUE_12440 [Promethearchaeota archaeon]
MAVMEVVIFFEGFILFVRRYQDVRAIQDDDVVANTLHATFLNLKENINMMQEETVSWNMTMDKHILHVLMMHFTLPDSDKKREIFAYIVEDKSVVQKDLKNVLERILQKFINDYRDRIKTMMKEQVKLPEFEEFIDNYLKKMTKKQYKRFFNSWNKPRIPFE